VKRAVHAAVLTSLAVLTTACGDDDDSGPSPITMVVYDSFPIANTALNDALADFSEETGIGVELLVAGDAGTMVSKAVLTTGTPEGDVMFGVDNTLLSATLRAEVFEPHKAAGLERVDERLTAVVPGGELTPVDFGDVCINYDIAWFAERELDPPSSLADLVRPEYDGLLVVEDPTTSSPGLAFLLATIAIFGDGGWQDFWRDLRANDVRVVDSWTTAYYDAFSGSAGSTGDRPLVVSYGSSPPSEVLFAEVPTDVAPTGVVEASCFRQVEFAGVLRGTEHPDEARRLVDFLIDERFQRELPLTLFVYPARADVALPQVFTRHAVIPERALTLAPAAIAANRTAWQDEWAQITLR